MKETVLGLNRSLKYYFYQDTINIGKGINSLSGLIKNDLMRNPKENEVFIFLSKNRRQVKILRWKNSAYILYTVKLYGGSYFKPEYNSNSRTFKMDWESFIRLISTYNSTQRKIGNLSI